MVRSLSKVWAIAGDSDLAEGRGNVGDDNVELVPADYRQGSDGVELSKRTGHWTRRNKAKLVVIVDDQI